MSMDAHEIQELARLQRIEREYIALRATTERVQQSMAVYGSDLNNPWAKSPTAGYNYRTEPAEPKNKKPFKSKLLLLCKSN